MSEAKDGIEGVTVAELGFENEFKALYSDKPSRPAMPIRLMVGVLLFKHLYNFGDEKIPSAWESNPYFQYFCRMAFFEHKFPCDPSDFVHFRKKIGEVRSQKRIGTLQTRSKSAKTDKNKVYSLHKSITECIARGKPHKQYEFGNKVGLITGGKKGKKHSCHQRLYWQPL